VPNLLDLFKAFLQRHFEAEVEPIEDGTIVFRMEDDDGQEWGCLAWVAEEISQVMFYSVLLESAPAERRDEAMRFVTLANYGMQVGNFELDLGDGEIRFKTSIDLEDTEPSDALFRNLVELNLAMMGRYQPGLLAVVRGALTAREAIASVENDAPAEVYEN
jgi:hypothetical protein